jgi:hypothetical protein
MRYLQKLALTSLTSGGRSVDIVSLRTQATEFSFFSLYLLRQWKNIINIILKHPIALYGTGCWYKLTVYVQLWFVFPLLFTTNI